MLKTFAAISRLHIVAIATLGTFTFGWLLSGRYSFGLAAVSGFDWFIVNLCNRVVDLPEDRENGITGTDFVARHRRLLVVLAFGTLLASLAGVHLVWPALLPLRAGYHALGLAYNWPLGAGRRRIKQLYFWKNTASATGFLITLFGYPLVTVGHADLPWAGVLALGGFFFLFELSYEVLYDLRDVAGDRLAAVRTYPVVHGERVAVRIVDGLIATSGIALVAAYAAGAVPWRAFVMIAAPGIQLAYYKRALARGITARDCIVLTWIGAALLLAYHLWVAAGLPGVG